LFPQECLVEIACGEEGEKELWMPAVVTEVVLIEKLKGVNPEPAIETLGQDDGKFLVHVSSLFLLFTMYHFRL
jgi:hypothetical protein